MYLIIYFLIISFIFRLFISIIYTQPGLGFLLLIAFAIFSIYSKRKSGVHGWAYRARANNSFYDNQNSSQNAYSSNKKDVFEAEYTEQEVH